MVFGPDLEVWWAEPAGTSLWVRFMYQVDLAGEKSGTFGKIFIKIELKLSFWGSIPVKVAKRPFYHEVRTVCCDIV